MDKITKELGKLEERKQQLSKEREQATAELERLRASAAELVLSGSDGDKIADKIHRLEIRLQALSGALSLLAEQDKAKREELKAAEMRQAADELSELDREAEQAFRAVIDAFFVAVDKLQEFELVCATGGALAAKYHLPLERGIRLQTWGEMLYNGLATPLYTMKSTGSAKYLNGRVVAPRVAPIVRESSPSGAVAPEYIPVREIPGVPGELQTLSPLKPLEPPKPGYLR